MTTLFLCIWIILGILIILMVVALSVSAYNLSKKVYKLVGIMYEEQQLILEQLHQSDAPTDVVDSDMENQEEPIIDNDIEDSDN